MSEVDRGSGLLHVPKSSIPVNLPSDTDAYRMGKLTVFCGPEAAAGESRWHLSVAHPDRLPEWEEIKYLRRRLLPEDKFFCLPWPPEEFWLNVHNYCLHLWEIRDPWLIEQMKADGSGSIKDMRGKLR